MVLIEHCTTDIAIFFIKGADTMMVSGPETRDTLRTTGEECWSLPWPATSASSPPVTGGRCHCTAPVTGRHLLGGERNN